MEIFYLVLLFLKIYLAVADKGHYNKINNDLIITEFGDFNTSEPIFASDLVLDPIKEIIISDSIEFRGLAIKSNASFFTISFYHLKGFDLLSNPFEKIQFFGVSFSTTILNVFNSKLDFYYKNELLSNNCSLALLNEPKFNHFLFNSFTVSFGTGIHYSDKTCPIIFQNSMISVIEFKQISSSIIIKNKLEFLDVNFFDKLNAKILQLRLDGYHYDLNDKLLNKYAFKTLSILDINGPINLIQQDLFKDFNYLKMIRIKTQYLKNLFVRNNKWIDYLNSKIYVDLSHKPRAKDLIDKILILVLYQMYTGVSYYDYPDEDFCYFTKFPHQRLVMPLLAPKSASSCSCTEIFLISSSQVVKKYIDQYVNFHSSSYYLIQYYTDDLLDKFHFTKCVNESFSFYIEKCNFPQRRNNCLIQQTKPLDKEFYFYMIDFKVVFDKSLRLLFILNKFLSFICICTFILSIKVLHSNKKISKEFYKTYKYLIVHNFFNTLRECLSFLDLGCNENLIKCVFESQIYLRYFKLITLKFIGNICKTGSNISYLLFTLSRFISVVKFKSGYFKKFDNISIKRYILMMLLFGSAINLYTLFQYSINNYVLSQQYVEIVNVRNLSNNYKYINQYDYRQDFQQFDHILLNFFQYFRIIFSDIIYIVFSILIDFLFFLIVKKQMKKKINLVFLSLTGNQKTKIQEKKIRQANKTYNRIASVIILNGFNFILLRLPSALFSFYGFIYIYDRTDMKYKPNIASYILCRKFHLCKTLAELLQTLYLISYLLQFFIFFLLDRNFRESLEEFFKFNRKLNNYIFRCFS